MKILVATMPERQVLLQVTDDADKVMMTINLEPEAAKGLGEQMITCAKMAEAGAPPKKMNS